MVLDDSHEDAEMSPPMDGKETNAAAIAARIKQDQANVAA